MTLQQIIDAILDGKKVYNGQLSERIVICKTRKGITAAVYMQPDVEIQLDRCFIFGHVPEEAMDIYDEARDLYQTIKGGEMIWLQRRHAASVEPKQTGGQRSALLVSGSLGSVHG